MIRKLVLCAFMLQYMFLIVIERQLLKVSCIKPKMFLILKILRNLRLYLHFWDILSLKNRAIIHKTFVWIV